MEAKIAEIAQRIKTLREILEISEEDMALSNHISVEEYRRLEAGESDFSFTFLLKCAEMFGVDMIELVTGENPKLSFYSIVRNGKGLPIKRRAGFTYNHIGALFKNKMVEPFVVNAPYSEEEQEKPIHLSRHEGQEFDYILQGSLKMAMENHIEILNEGDSIIYDSGYGHGMIATGGKDCKFLAVVIKPHTNENENV